MVNGVGTTVCIAGGGPAGLVLGLVLARGGIRVTVLEKHADFLRDFRGDTVHASTLTLLDELGLAEEFAALPQRRVDRAQIQLDAGTATVADLSRLPGPHRQIALVPQWDLLELLATTAAREPTFTLRRQAEVVGLLRDGDDGEAVTGVRFLDHTDHTEHDLRAAVTVACDGRDSTLRRSAGLRPRVFGVPMDVEWFRLPRWVTDPSGLVARLSAGRMVVLIDRGDYWQCAYLVRKGGDDALRAQPIEQFRRRLAQALPWLDDRTPALGSWDDVHLLVVSLNRLRRWYRRGLLLIGDAAHAMSPIGGVGINLAIQDAVAAARILGRVLREQRPVEPSTLRKVQLRRWWPTVATQTAQRIAHRFVIGRALGAAAPDQDGRSRHGLLAPQPRLPWPIRVVNRLPALPGLLARAIAIGPLPEHAPGWACPATSGARPSRPIPGAGR